MKINLENWHFELIPTIFICVFFPLFLYFTFWLFIKGIIGLFRMLKSKKWKHTIGEIISAEIKYRVNTSSDVGFDIDFILQKIYKYHVNDVQYESKQNFVTDSLYTKDYKSLDTITSKYPKYHTSFEYIDLEKEKIGIIGRKITVYYDPKNPKKSCLIKGLKYEIFIPIGMGLFFGTGLVYITWNYLLRPIFTF